MSLWYMRSFGRMRKRAFDGVALLILTLIIYFTPDWFFEPGNITAKMAFVSLMIMRAYSIAAGILWADFSRKFLFPSISLETSIKNNHWGALIFLSFWYGIIIYVFGTGG